MQKLTKSKEASNLSKDKIIKEEKSDFILFLDLKMKYRLLRNQFKFTNYKNKTFRKRSKEFYWLWKFRMSGKLRIKYKHCQIKGYKDII